MQHNLIEQIANVSNKVILVILSGGCVDISQELKNDKIMAILWAGYGGMWGGQAIADVLFGKFNPVARLTQTWYQSNYVNEVSMLDMSMRPVTNGTAITNPGRGYRFFTGEPIFRFGDGLRYIANFKQYFSFFVFVFLCFVDAVWKKFEKNEIFFKN